MRQADSRQAVSGIVTAGRHRPKPDRRQADERYQNVRQADMDRVAVCRQVTGRHQLIGARQCILRGKLTLNVKTWLEFPTFRYYKC